MLRFFPNAKRSLDSLLILITDLVTEGLLFFRLLFRSRTALSASPGFCESSCLLSGETGPTKTMNDSARFSLILLVSPLGLKEALVIVNPRS